MALEVIIQGNRMATKPLNKYTKQELIERCESLKITEIKAEDSDNIKNSEYVTAIEEFAKKQNGVNSGSVKEDEKAAKEPKGEKIDHGKVLSTEDRIALLYVSLPVIVTCHDNTVIIDDDEEGRVEEFSWGNAKIGMTSAKVKLDGKMQYLQIGAIKKLKTLVYAHHTKDSAGNPISSTDRAKFSVAETTGWTQEQLEAQKKSQALRKI